MAPNKLVFEGEIQQVQLPGSSGNFLVLRDHAPLVSILGKGHIIYKDATREHILAIEGGLVEVCDNQIVVLVETEDSIQWLLLNPVGGLNRQTRGS